MRVRSPSGRACAATGAQQAVPQTQPCHICTGTQRTLLQDPHWDSDGLTPPICTRAGRPCLRAPAPLSGRLAARACVSAQSRAACRSSSLNPEPFRPLRPLRPEPQTLTPSRVPVAWHARTHARVRASCPAVVERLAKVERVDMRKLSALRQWYVVLCALVRALENPGSQDHPLPSAPAVQDQYRRFACRHDAVPCATRTRMPRAANADWDIVCRTNATLAPGRPLSQRGASVA